MTEQAMETALPDFTLRPVPQVHFGAGRARRIAEDAAALALPGKAAALIVDGTLQELGLAAGVIGGLEAAGLEVAVFAEISGEPEQAQVEAATEFLRGRDAGLVVCLGGGSALDIGKIAACVAPTGRGPADFAMKAESLPGPGLPKICLPTTAGTGSELSSTNIFHGENGKKVWIWSTRSKPDAVILDPELTTSLPPRLTAWTGLDAFVHALESCSNVWRQPANDLYAHRALALIAGALERAVAEPENLQARGRMLLGSAYAGIAIDNCNVAMAHNISHALAALAPVHHGLATALGLAAVLPWQAEADQGPFAAAAQACGLAADARALSDWYADLLDRCGVERRLPEAFKAFGAADLAREMRAPETAFSRESSARKVEDDDIDRFAAAVMAMA